MRTLGPGSVSSILKVILEVVYVGLWVTMIGMALLSLTLLIYDFDPAAFGKVEVLHLDQPDESAALVTFGLVSATAYVAGVLIIVDRLRRIFSTLTAGDPFHPDNVRRLRVVALMLAGLELGGYLVAGIHVWLSPAHKASGKGVSLTAWFAVLVVFVLAEVFREGARLRREAELTI
jgi:hypothetical protein